MGLLSECFGTVLTFKGFLPSVGSHVHLDVALVEETSAANITVMHHLFVTRSRATAATAAHAAQLWPDPAAPVFLLDLCQAAQLVEPPLQTLI